jgi:hypothetical protein
MTEGRKTGGRKKGVPNKTTLKFRELLAEEGVEVEKQLAAAILARDVEMIEVLTKLLPYLTPRLKEQERPTEPAPTEVTPSLDSLSNEDLLKLLDKATDPESAPPTRSYN